MARIIHSVLVQDVTPATDGIYAYDLPINPLSHIWLTLKCLNAGVNTKATLAQLLGALERVDVLYRGQAIISVNGADLYALNVHLLGREPWQENVINTDNATRMLSLCVPMTRVPFSPVECFFPTSKGELQLQVQIDIADTGYDGVIFQIETVELPDAKPSSFVKATTLTATPTATGDMDVDIPIGNKLAGILLWGTTVPTGTAWTTTIDQARLLIDNVEYGIAKTNWESLHGSAMLKLSPPGAWGEKLHLSDVAAVYTQNQDTAAEEQVNTDVNNYAFMDFMPLKDDSYLIDTKGKSRVNVRIVAGDTNPLRVIPVEVMSVR